MSASRATRSRRGGEDRFYCPPAMRRLQQQQQQQQRLHPNSNKSSKPSSKASSSDADRRTDSETSSTTKELPSAPSSSLSTPRASDLTNLDRFLEHTTPWVQAQHVSKMSMRAWRMREHSPNPYFILGDLWESFGEWSAYGAGVPLVMNDIDSVVQYYVPYLSGIQLYIDPLKSAMKLRRPGEESDGDSSRDSSSDGSNEYSRESNGNNHQASWSQHKRGHNAVTGSSSDESDVTNPPGLLTFEYFEQDSPYGREPLADKIVVLASMFPKLKTFRSCDLNPASWVSVAWYPIYRIPTGPTLKNLDACFLTFHSLSTPTRGVNSSSELDNPGKLSLQTFGLASYKFKADIWNSNGVHESQKFSSLLNAAGNWLRLLEVNHPDYTFFSSHNSQWR
ncbi:uncharacterized protein LOC124936131 [Impatiens glandulifera]|uniref:uncharacterized protein LOC124936131 n=1 Tax=Impatiens glandulifera TaxID=253017 RepID=UPI001FB10A08|nr:uncharacterized protein LOC124936131 [Impatiens glandulifera]